MYDITNTALIGNCPAAATREHSGTSGIINDSASGSGQASSIYFASQSTTTGPRAGPGGPTPRWLPIAPLSSLSLPCNKADRDLDRQHHFSAGDLLLFDDAAGKMVLQRNYRDLICRRITIFRLLEPRAWASLKLR